MSKIDDDALRAAYLKGFMASGEGWNGEYGAGDNPESDDYFCRIREEALFAAQEPDLEEGWYEVSFGSAGLTFAFYSEPNWYRDDDSAHEALDPLPIPHFIGQRHYLSDQYRPADICPPPLTGEPFEVEGMPQITFSLGFAVSGVLEVISSGSRRPVYDWLSGKRWRPQQAQP
ncbi:hypothetical protein [Denitrobaculum tricleocarpae]|uniref:Uncharacterized protein n=1 Tax=Denitrobaculum tricleocarpae TaxID=2591009 RepID=A0A545TSY9_9PROT|nr:hypothetical protein [Denitrobaculum tricleocarpae]TQV80339.1 hypothetical protein FKG95_09090 [Denitrobaculum tricleocarpae]